MLVTDIAIGGAGGNNKNGAGNGFRTSTLSSGGSASYSATGSNAGSKSVTVSSSARGGDGGYWVGLYGKSLDANSGDGGNGGAASSSAIASNLGLQSVYASSNATGGAAGTGFGLGTRGLGGNAQAHTLATSTGGYVSSSATANGGSGSGLASLVTADATSKGGNGSTARAQAKQSNYASISSTATVSNGISGTSEAKASLGQSAPGASLAIGKEAVAYGTALPMLADINTLLENHSTVSHDFNIGGNRQVWLLGNQGVLNTALDGNLHIYSSLLKLDINTAGISHQQDLLLGLLSPVLGVSNLGVNDTLAFNIVMSGAGGSQTQNYSFSDLYSLNDPNSAANFFHDKTLDLGAWSGLVTADNTNLDIALSLNLHSQASNAGMTFNYILGNSTLASAPVSHVPVPAASWLFGSALLGLTGLNHRKQATV